MAGMILTGGGFVVALAGLALLSVPVALIVGGLVVAAAGLVVDA